MRDRAVVVGWVAFILAATLPWTSFRSHAHWDRVVWVPFRSGSVRPMDVVANVALYTPLGWGGTRRRADAKGAAYAVVLSALLSCGCEWSQVYSHGRFPSATDVASNVTGAVLGVFLALWWARRARGRAV